MTEIHADWLISPGFQTVSGMLNDAGFRALAVGGAVRNTLLQQPVSDVDMATDATPEVVLDLARKAGLKAIPTGIDHGTITVVSHGQPFEITTFRRDVKTDGRRAVVAFSDRLEDDAQRRDFTMNALYATPSGEVIDPVGGLPDLAAHRLRFVGRPEARIREDYLRILRFFRFLAWYGREAEPEAVAACAALAPGLAAISRERVGAEVRKLLSAPDPGAALALMAQTGVLEQVLPGADLARLTALLPLEPAPSWRRRLAALAPNDIADALRLSRDEAKAQAALNQALTAGISLEEAAYRLGPLAEDYALLQATIGALPADWRARIASAAPLPVRAADLPGLQGPALGAALRAAEAEWIASGFTASRPALLSAAKKG